MRLKITPSRPLLSKLRARLFPQFHEFGGDLGREKQGMVRDGMREKRVLAAVCERERPPPSFLGLGFSRVSGALSTFEDHS